MAGIDLGFVLAVVAFGWGLELSPPIGLFAKRYGWPWGHGTETVPGCRSLLGVLAHPAGASLFALARGYGGHIG